MRQGIAAALAAAALLFSIGCGDRPADSRSGVFTSRGNPFVAYSPDGKTLAAVGWDDYGNEVLLFDAETGDVKKALEGDNQGVRSAAFSPDGKTLVSGGWDNSIRVWDVQTGELLKTLTALGEDVAVVYSPDGKTLVSGSKYGRIQFWDAETWTLIASDRYNGTIASLAYSPNGQRLAVGLAQSSEVHLRDGFTYERVESLRGHRDNVVSVAYSPDGKLLASGGSEGEILLWDANTGKRLKILTKAEGSPVSVVFSPDSKTLLGENERYMARQTTTSGSRVSVSYYSHDGKTRLGENERNNIRLWDVQTGELIKTIQNPDASRSVVYSPDGTTIASGNLAGVHLWSAETGERIKTLGDYSHAVRFLAYSPDGGIVFASNAKGRIGMLDAKPLKIRKPLHPLFTWSLKGSAALSPDGETLVAGTMSSDLVFWHVAAHHWDDDKRRAGKEAAQKELLARAKHLALNAKSDISRRFAVTLEDAANRSVYNFPLDRTFGSVHCIAYSPDGKTIAAGGSRTLVLSESETAHVKAIIKGHKGRVRFAAFSPDGKTLVSGSLDQTVRFWDAETGAAIRDLKGHEGMAYAGAYSPDGKTLAVASSETLAVWDAATDALLHMLEGHNGPAYCLAFSPDGAEIATGGRDRTVRRWSAETGELIKTMEKHAAPVTAVVYSPDGAHLLSGGADGKIHRWSLND